MTNIPKIYLFGFFWQFLVLMPVVVPFFQHLGLNMEQIFQLQAIFGVAVVALEVPTGYLGDWWGRKKALLVGSFFSGIAFTSLLFLHSFQGLIVYEILAATGLSLVSGADLALLYDSVDSGARSKGTHSLANLQFCSMSGEASAAILGGVLATASFRHVTIANAISGWVPFLVALSFKEPQYQKMDKRSHLENFREVIAHLFSRKDPVLPLAALNLVVWGLSTYIVVWMLQPYWKENAIPLASFGMLWAAFNFSAALMGKTVHRLERQAGSVPLLVVLGLAPILGYLAIGLLGGILGVASGVLFYLSRGITGVLLKDALNWRTPAKYRATANSLCSFLFRCSFAIVGPGIGFLIDHQGLRPTSLILSGSFAILFLTLLVPLILHIKRNRASSPEVLQGEEAR